MTSQDPQNHNHSDRDDEVFERYLGGDDELATDYAKAAMDAPDELLDAQVRKAARIAAKAGTKTSSPWSGAMRNLAALAAVIVVTVGLLASLSVHQTAYQAPPAPTRLEAPQTGGRLQTDISPQISVDAERNAGDAAREAPTDIPAGSAPRSTVIDTHEEHRANADTAWLSRSKTDETLNELPVEAAETRSPTYAAETDAPQTIEAENAPAPPSLGLDQRGELRRERSAAYWPPAEMMAAEPMQEPGIAELQAIHALLEASDTRAAQERWRGFQRDYPEFPMRKVKVIFKDHLDFLDANPRLD